MIRPMSVPIGDTLPTDDRVRERFRVVVLPIRYPTLPLEVINRARLILVTGGGRVEKDNHTPDAEWIKDALLNGDPDAEPSDPDIEWGS